MKDKIDMKTRIIGIIALALVFASCSNQPNDFDDFGITGCYFPFQTPARTLILGDYPLGDNENDNNHRFEIGVTMAGVYENEQERKVHFKVAPELLANVDNVVELPSAYYTIETASPVAIPAGDIKGRITVQLTDAFFKDELSYAGLNKVNYVVPLLITDVENLDTVLVGEAAVDNPDRLNSADWTVVPKDYTLFGIKFINQYHAYYLRRGVDVMTNSEGAKVESVYREQYVEDDELVMVSTTGDMSVELSNRIRRGSESSPGNAKMELVFNENNTCQITSEEDAKYQVSGTGQFVDDGDEWGGEPRDVIYLDYTYTDEANNETHHVMDTLVVRNRNVVFEEFTIELNE